jgi:hypothetical protein
VSSPDELLACRPIAGQLRVHSRVTWRLVAEALPEVMRLGAIGSASTAVVAATARASSAFGALPVPAAKEGFALLYQQLGKDLYFCTRQPARVKGRARGSSRGETRSLKRNPPAA